MAALNVKTVTERGGRVFPKNGSAPEVVEALVKWNQKNKVEIKTNSKVLDILQEDERVQGVKVCNVSSILSGYRRDGSCGVLSISNLLISSTIKSVSRFMGVFY